MTRMPIPSDPEVMLVMIAVIAIVVTFKVLKGL